MIKYLFKAKAGAGGVVNATACQAKITHSLCSGLKKTKFLPRPIVWNQYYVKPQRPLVHVNYVTVSSIPSKPDTLVLSWWPRGSVKLESCVCRMGCYLIILIILCWPSVACVWRKVVWTCSWSISSSENMCWFTTHISNKPTCKIGGHAI